MACVAEARPHAAPEAGFGGGRVRSGESTVRMCEPQGPCRVVLSVPCEPAALVFSSSLCWCLVIFLSENEVVLCAYLTNVTSLEAAGFSSGVSFLFVFVGFR